MSTKHILKWLDDNLLTLLTAFLIVFIPLYPKIPLADVLPGYIVRLRLEDFVILFTFAVFILQLTRRRVALPKYRVAKLIFIYLLVGFLSTLSAIFITRSIPLLEDHIFKAFLHFFRRIEYFSLFFIAYSATRTAKQLKIFLAGMILTSVAVTLYGFGQKYLYWPAYSTMNREFSKGMRLYLAPHSRVMSTFAGHYDLAAYVMILLSIVVPIMWFVQHRLLKLAGTAVFILLYWTLILTASRTSFIAYLVSIAVIALLLAFLKGIRWIFPRYLAVMVFSMLIMLTIGDLSDRFLQLIKFPALSKRIVSLQQKLAEPFKQEPPANSISDDELAAIAARSDQPPKPAGSASPKPSLPPDVTATEDENRRRLEATASGQATPEPAGGYSPNALKYGLSVAIRLDALWPRALAGFKQNPLLGSGYSTLVKSNNEEFTQAESTDNDYLRMLGETGILGTFTFLAIPIILSLVALKNLRVVVSDYDRALLVGFIGATVGILVNASYIDVFESSKVVYTYWLLAALIIKVIEFSRSKGEKILY